MVLSGAAALPSGTLTKLFSFSASAEVASGTCGDNITWTLDDNGKLTISGTGFLFGNHIFENNPSIKTLVIEYGITGVSTGEFMGCSNLEEISVADSVTRIGNNTFTGSKWLDEQRKKDPFVIINDILVDAATCKGEVTIPQRVRVIGEDSFYKAPIWKVNIPESVEIIDFGAFERCMQLTSINIPDSVHTIGSSAFMDCNLWSVQIGKGVKTIDSEAFYGNKNLSEITIPDNVETVGFQAFRNCKNLMSVNIGSGVKTLSPDCFLDCEKLEEINLSKDNPYYTYVNDVIYNKDMTELALTQNTKYWYISEGVIRIQKGMSNESVEYVYLPDTVKEIDEFGFSGCAQLKSISLPSTLERIGLCGLDGCTSIEEIVIPDNVTFTDQCVMSTCYNLKKIDLSCNPLYTLMSSDSFSYNYSLETIEIPQNIKTIGGDSFYCCSSLKSVTLHEGLKEIEWNAFLNCEKLKSVKIPKSVTHIYDQAFGYNNSWKEDEATYKMECIPDFTIYCYKGTEGERYAKDNGFKYVLLEECKHDYSVEKVPATCLKFGYDLHTCKKCGEKFKDNFTDLLGHDWSDWKQTEKPSCTKLGSDSRTCKHCGLTISRSVSKAQHSWSDWKVTEKPTASKFGLKERSCTVCGKTTTELMPKDESVKDIYRLAGKNRYETAANISSVSTPFSDNVVIACGMNYADALAGVPLANALNAPILLTEKDTLPKETLDEINRIKAKNVFLLGGEGAISADVEKALLDKSLKVERIAGSTRFETATKIAEKMQTVSGKAPSEVFFVYAFNFADALSASTAAAVKGAPIIYLKTIGEIDNATKSYLGTVKGKVKTAYVIGGSGVISNKMKSSTASALGLTSPASVQRIAGTDRYETCVAVNSTFNGVLTGNSFCIATGQDFPDALAGGVYAAQNKAPLFLVNGKEKTLRLSDAQAAFLKSKKTDSFHVFGGVGVVPDEHIQVLSKASA